MLEELHHHHHHLRNLLKLLLIWWNEPRATRSIIAISFKEIERTMNRCDFNSYKFIEKGKKSLTTYVFALGNILQTCFNSGDFTTLFIISSFLCFFFSDKGFSRMQENPGKDNSTSRRFGSKFVLPCRKEMHQLIH